MSLENLQRKAPRTHLDANHLNWLLWKRRSSCSTPSSLWMSELFTLSIRVSPATLRRKLIVSAIPYFWSLPKSYDRRWGLECRMTGKLKALFSGSALSSPQWSSTTATLLLRQYKSICRSYTPCYPPGEDDPEIQRYLNSFTWRSNSLPVRSSGRYEGGCRPRC